MLRGAFEVKNGLHRFEGERRQRKNLDIQERSDHAMGCEDQNNPVKMGGHGHGRRY